MTQALVKGRKMESEELSWLELHMEYKKGEKKLGGFIADTKGIDDKGIEEEVNLENARALKNNIKAMEREIKRRVFIEFNSLSKEDIKKCNLTEHQMKIALLKQKHSNREIAKMLNIDQSNVAITFKRAVNKILNYHKNKELSVLSPMERKVYRLHCEGKTRKQIGEELSTTPGSVRTRMHRVRKKLGLKGVTKNV